MNNSWLLQKRISAISRITSARELPRLSRGSGTTLARRGIAIAGLWTGAALAASAFLVWQRGFGDLVTMQSPALLLASAPAAISYLLRLVRWHILLRRVGGKVPLLPSLSVQSIGFALSATPGRAGEVFKLYLLDRHWGVSLTRGGAVLLFERMSDALGLAAVAVFGVLLVSDEMLDLDLVLRQAAVPMSVLIVATVAVWRAKRTSGIRRNQLHRWRQALTEFSAANRDLLHSAAVPSAFILTIFARTCDALSVYVVAESLGLSLSFPQAAVVLGIGGLAGGISLLPGGIGAADVAMAGLLVGKGATASAGLATALIVRVFTYWFWVAIGLANLAILYRRFTQGGKDAHLPGIHPSSGT